MKSWVTSYLGLFEVFVRVPMTVSCLSGWVPPICLQACMSGCAVVGQEDGASALFLCAAVQWIVLSEYTHIGARLVLPL